MKAKWGRVFHRHGALLLTALAATLVVSGCASYSQKALKVREPLARGDYAAAEQFLVEEKPGGDGLPYLLELGLVQRYSGQLEQSNATFQRAEDLVDALWTKSISKELLAFATSDETIPYSGEMWERALIHYYRALNYIDLGSYESALVECRKLNQRLSVYVASEDDPPAYAQDAFGQYLTAVLYEAAGELNDAWVSLRLADDGYLDWSEKYGVEAPRLLQQDLVRLAEQQGFRDEAERYRARFGDAADGPSTRELLGRGEVIFFWESGFAPAKEQVETTIPILKKEWGEEHVLLGPTLAHRYHHPIYYDDAELEYLLRIALPTFPSIVVGQGPPGYAQLEARPAATTERSAAPRAVVGQAETELMTNLDAISRRGLEDRSGTILLRTILRALSKYGLTRLAQKEGGDVGKLVANLFGAATEKADTRSWVTMPRSIHMARLRVPPGVHDIEITCFRANGRVQETVTFEGVEVGAGEVRFLSHRSY